MLSYRHAFHAGNHADVLKHFILMQVLAYANQKDKPYWYIDTHAGAGLYQLTTGYAAQNAEYESGILPLSRAQELTQPLAAFVSLVQSLNNNGSSSQLHYYPGSPVLAQQLIRDGDKMRLFELHPNDCKILIGNFKGADRAVKIEKQDGFTGIKAILPPPTRRAVVLIDPPYEEKQDYQRVVSCLKDSMERFATGTYLIWYPLLQRPEPEAMIQQIHKLGTTNWLHASLSVQQPAVDGFGMFGSGMYVINPPWTLPAILEESMPQLADLLGKEGMGSFHLDYQIT